MQRFLLLVWLVGCTADGSDETSGDDDGDGEVSSEAQDREECRNPTIPACPPGFGYQFYGGAADDQLMVVDLEVDGDPVCNGEGRFVDAESLEGADLVGVHVTRNTQCTFGCFAGCTFTNVCWSDGVDGRSCAHACTVPDLDELECTALVGECLGGHALACEAGAMGGSPFGVNGQPETR
jgi:hypothetical protein